MEVRLIGVGQHGNYAPVRNIKRFIVIDAGTVAEHDAGDVPSVGKNLIVSFIFVAGAQGCSRGRRSVRAARPRWTKMF